MEIMSSTQTRFWIGFALCVLLTFVILTETMLGQQTGTSAVEKGAKSPSPYTRAALLEILSNYLDALVKHNPEGLPLSKNLRATENGSEVKLGEGIWKTASSFSYRHSFVDASTGQAGFHGVVREGDQPAIMALRLRVEDGKITEVETLVARRGAHPLFNPESLHAPKAPWAASVPEQERSSRTKMIAAIQSYFDAIEQSKPEIVPLHPDCTRTENGVQTTNNPPDFSLSCADSIAGLTYVKRVRDRRFPIVDESRGLVWAIVHFDVPGDREATPPMSDPQIQAQLKKPRTLLLYELFKIEDGRISEIEAFMSNAPLGATVGWPSK
jgi:hypothetical protein